MGRDFWVSTPCKSIAYVQCIDIGQRMLAVWLCSMCCSHRSDRVMEGMRLTIQGNEPDGVDFSIRMPHTPQRCAFISASRYCIVMAVIDKSAEPPTGCECDTNTLVLAFLFAGLINLTWNCKPFGTDSLSRRLVSRWPSPRNHPTGFQLSRLRSPSFSIG